MTFLNWAILFGLSAIAIPVLIHLMNRRRAKVVEWGAMRFLLASAASRNRRIMLEEILLMILRCLAVAVLVLAVARPYLPSRSNIGWAVVIGGVVLGVVALAVAAVLRGKGLVRLVRLALLVVAVCLLCGSAYVSLYEQQVQQKLWSVKGDGKDVAIVLDASASMTLARDGVTNFQRAVEEARAVVASCKHGDRVALILAGPSPRLVVPPVYELPKVLHELGEVGPIGGSLGVLEALDLATAVLDQGDNPQKKVVLITDTQDIGWRVNDEARWKALASAMLSGSRVERPEVVVRTLALPESLRNLAVADLKFSRAIIGTDRPVRIEATIANTGTETVGPADVELTMDGARVGVRSVGEISPGASETVSFEHQFTRAGLHTAVAKLSNVTLTQRVVQESFRTASQPGLAVAAEDDRDMTIEGSASDSAATNGSGGGDDLAADDSAVRVVHVIQTLPVLLVDGRPAAGSLEAASAFLYTALSPRATWPPRVAGIDQPIVPVDGARLVTPPAEAASDEAAGGPLIQPTVIAAADIARVKDFSAYRLVILANVPRLDAASAESLARFVTRGGGLLIAPGDQANPAFYAGWQAPIGGPVAPATLVERDVPKTPVHLALNSFTHPALKLVADADMSDAGSVLVRSYWNLRADAKDSAVRVAGLLENGLPLLVERKVGKGFVLMTAFSLDARDSNFCQANSFVTLAHEVAHYLASPVAPVLNFPPGGEVALPLSLQGTDALPEQGRTLPVTTPSGRHGEAAVVTLDGTPHAIFRSLEEPGLYRVDLPAVVYESSYASPEERAERAATSTLPFTVFNDVAESSLTTLSSANLSRVGEFLPLFHVQSGDELTSRVAGGIPGQELWRYLAVAALAALVAEIALTRWIAIQRRADRVVTVQFGTEAFDAQQYRAKAKELLAERKEANSHQPIANR
ncbi:MAG: BatA domain-containing protein [Phycisphaerae bacterium]|nr:BatA domain-containing protein [Phycisphaerae bacterium]